MNTQNNTSSTRPTLWSSPIFGPVRSRRLGVSLGINLMPGDGKICSFDCAYCECGLNAECKPHTKAPTRQEVATALERKLLAMQADGLAPDVLTFAGNGEPTCHPHFVGIMEDTVRLRNKYFPKAKISVLSNGTQVHRSEIRKALMLADNNIQKLDTVNQQYVMLIDRPVDKHYDINKVVDNLCLFDGHVIVQTMFLGGTIDGQDVCNTTDNYVMPWLEALCRIRPQSIMVYTIDRPTPLSTLAKAPAEELDRIADMVRAEGMECSVAY